ncbi:MAG: hypothetical protein IPK11_12700 [Ignavibacteria bacterium]|nr:hypothetical protein [Ignavibacteria bacterium]
MAREATVYVCRNEQQQLLAQQRSIQIQGVRSFRNDTVYRDNRFIGSKRLKKPSCSIQKRAWMPSKHYGYMEEFRQLHYFYSHNIEYRSRLHIPAE